MQDMKFGYDAINSDDGPVLLAITGSGDMERFTDKHSHARGQLFASLRGLLSVGLVDGMWIVPAIHAVWMPPHATHSIRKGNIADIQYSLEKSLYREIFPSAGSRPLYCRPSFHDSMGE